MKKTLSTAAFILALSFSTPTKANAGALEGALIGAGIGALVGLILALFIEEEPKKIILEESEEAYLLRLTIGNINV